jgi:hypothetical protein
MAKVKNTYRTVTTYLVVPDADTELRFLKAAFNGTEVECHRNPDNTVMHAENCDWRLARYGGPSSCGVGTARSRTVPVGR